NTVARSLLVSAVVLSATLATGPLALGATAAPPDLAVEVRTMSYAPNDITIPRGTTVVWQNVTSPNRVHDVVSSIPSLFFSAHFGTGQQFSYRFAAAGTFTYICSIHDVMIGAVHVPLTSRTMQTEAGPMLRVRLATEALPADSHYRYVVLRRDPGQSEFAIWRFTRQKALDFLPPAPGTYEFVMRVKNVDADWVTGAAGDSPILSVAWPG
ncbi:MAG: plastocyanin/azurin family copper-binding protein, partial [Candidatus Limnocylindrales bacterium]